MIKSNVGGDCKLHLFGIQRNVMAGIVCVSELKMCWMHLMVLGKGGLSKCCPVANSFLYCFAHSWHPQSSHSCGMKESQVIRYTSDNCAFSCNAPTAHRCSKTIFTPDLMTFFNNPSCPPHAQPKAYLCCAQDLGSFTY